jgi:hypothetical protein
MCERAFTTDNARLAASGLFFDEPAYNLWVLNTVNLSRDRLTVFSTHSYMLVHLSARWASSAWP